MRRARSHGWCPPQVPTGHSCSPLSTGAALTNCQEPTPGECSCRRGLPSPLLALAACPRPLPWPLMGASPSSSSPSHPASTAWTCLPTRPLKTSGRSSTWPLRTLRGSTGLTEPPHPLFFFFFLCCSSRVYKPNRVSSRALWCSFWSVNFRHLQYPSAISRSGWQEGQAGITSDCTCPIGHSRRLTKLSVLRGGACVRLHLCDSQPALPPVCLTSDLAGPQRGSPSCRPSSKALYGTFREKHPNGSGGPFSPPPPWLLGRNTQPPAAVCLHCWRR